MWNNKLQGRIEAIGKQSGCTFHTCEINKGVNDDFVSRIVSQSELILPEEFLSFYREMDGIDISWTLEKDDQEIYGSIFILPLKEVVFGYNGSVNKICYDNAFEDVLWNEFYSDKKIKELKQHRLLESIEGDSSFITFKLLEENIQLFYIYEEEIKPLQVSFTNYLNLIIQYLGASDIREYLKSKQWEQKISTDKDLQLIASQ